MFCTGIREGGHATPRAKQTEHARRSYANLELKSSQHHSHSLSPETTNKQTINQSNPVKGVMRSNKHSRISLLHREHCKIKIKFIIRRGIALAESYFPHLCGDSSAYSTDDITKVEKLEYKLK